MLEFVHVKNGLFPNLFSLLSLIFLMERLKYHNLVLAKDNSSSDTEI